MENFNLHSEGKRTFANLFAEIEQKRSGDLEVATITAFFYKHYEEMNGIVAMSRNPLNKELFGGKGAYEMIATLCNEAEDFPFKDKRLTREEVSTYLTRVRKKKGLAKQRATAKVPPVASPAVPVRVEAKPVAPVAVESPVVASMPPIVSVEAPKLSGKTIDQLRQEGWTDLKFGELSKKYSKVFDPRTLTWNEELADLESYLFFLAPEEQLKVKGASVRNQGPGALRYGDLYDLLQRVKALTTTKLA